MSKLKPHDCMLISPSTYQDSKHMMSQLFIHELFDFGCLFYCDDGVCLFKLAHE
jgi:hypothetical protein